MIAYTIYLDLGPTLIQNQTVIAESTFPLVVHSIIIVSTSIFYCCAYAVDHDDLQTSALRLDDDYPHCCSHWPFFCEAWMEKILRTQNSAAYAEFHTQQ